VITTIAATSSRGFLDRFDRSIWLGRDCTEDRFEAWRPDRLLTGLLETDGGYLEPALT
jgi:hypothetical protein